MSTIRFDFTPAKLASAIAFFAFKGVPKLDKLKTVKLLYFADKDHLLTHGRPILGDVYFCMPHGPVPSYSKNVIDDVLDGSDSSELLLQYVAVIRTKEHKYPQFVRKQDPDLTAFSTSEIASLERTLAKYGSMDPWPLRQLSHDEPCWQIVKSSMPEGLGSAPMPYELFFEGQSPEAKAMLDLVLEEQEDRDFSTALAK